MPSNEVKKFQNQFEAISGEDTLISENSKHPLPESFLELLQRCPDVPVTRYQRSRDWRASGTECTSTWHTTQTKLVDISPNCPQWKADTTGYPDAAALGYPTVYRADATHKTGDTHEVVVVLPGASVVEIVRHAWRNCWKCKSSRP